MHYVYIDFIINFFCNMLLWDGDCLRVHFHVMLLMVSCVVMSSCCCNMFLCVVSWWCTLHMYVCAEWLVLYQNFFYKC
jgi:hypothetical protein